MKICESCGKGIPEDSVFCNYCGAPLSKEDKKTEKKAPKKVPSALFVFFDISIGLALCTASVFIYFFSNYDAIGNLRYLFMSLHLIIVPALCLLLVAKGIIGIVRIRKADKEK